MREIAPSIPHQLRLDGRRILITGAAGGIGAATARVCFELGATVLLTDTSSCEALAAELTRDGKPASWTQTDVTNPLTPKQLAEWCGELDALILSHGIYKAIDWDSEDWDEQTSIAFEVNLRASMRLAREFANQMARKGNGRIVFVGSVAALTGGTFPGVGPHYAISKGGIHTLVRYLAARYTPSGLLINGVAPGTIDTPMLKDINLEQAIARQPLKRAAKPEEVAWPIAFLCSQGASFISGAILDVNGGNYMRP